jgi:DNA-binding NarL/FixJ family response regulator
LIVDDSAPMRRLIRTLVADLAEVIYECDSGSGALALYAAHRPDWVLMDVAMEPVDGLTATRQVTAAFPRANVIVITEHGDAATREAALAAGAREFVAKENLLDVRRILTGRRDSEPRSTKGARQ